MNRRRLLLSALGSAIVGRSALAAAPAPVDVYKSPTCGCCSAWVKHMAAAGFAVETHDVAQEALWVMKDRAGITPELGSCHTAFAQGYCIEGHVPASDVMRLLSERPDALGLAVPGMPVGSPGMEMGDDRDPFDTLLLLRDGNTRLFQRHA